MAYPAYRQLRRDLRFLEAWAAISTLCMAGLAGAAFRQAPAPRNLGEINVERINVVDSDGTLRMVISNKSRMHPGVMDGIVIDRPRPVAGMIFFNDQGDEVGGLTFTGEETAGQRRADAGMMFDQLKQDQTIGFSYSEENGQRMAGFQVWDRADSHLSELIAKLNAANRIADASERQKAIAAARSSAPRGPRRVFVGKERDRVASVSLADGDGRPRLTLRVEPTGQAAIELRDENGKVTDRWPAGR
ncbi:MAG TPA: hypothetical protein VNZ26_23370 [Vicinamibacterales bacterium]|jgi:hypothetical protein|nr:hypothetical protein [Vicinamibacterales bacterium]